MRRSTQISLICGAVILGIVIGRGGAHIPGQVVLAVGLVTLMLSRSRLGFLALIIFALSLGLWRTDAYLADQARLTALIGQKVDFTATVEDDPALSTKGYLEFKAGHLVDHGRNLPGVITVRMFPTNLHRGYRVSLSGKLGDGFGSVPAEMFYPAMAITSKDLSPLERFRQRFFVGIRTALPEPAASFGLGLLVGVRGLVPKDLQTQLNLVGLSHLVAVSGYNLTIMVAAAHRLFERFGKGIAMVASLWLIGGFLLVTGASASIVRASVVAILALLAMYYGRRFNPLTLILIAASGTALFKPAYLTDLGWLLSFIGFFAVMVVSPSVAARLGNPRFLAAQIFIETMTAHVLTVPLILYYFSQLSIAAPITNVLVLPLVPLAMLTGLIAGLGGMVVPAFSGWLAWPAALILRYMLEVVHWFARQPWAASTMHIDFSGMLIMYAVLGVGVIALKRSNIRARRPEETLDVLNAGGAGMARG